MAGYRQEARLYLDGNKWCAVGYGFTDLATCNAGFGDTQGEAIEDLKRQDGPTAMKLNDADFVVGGYCRRCKEWVPEGETPDGCRDPDCPCQ